MHFSSAFVLAALPFLAFATPLPSVPAIAIPLLKRDILHTLDGVVDLEAIRAQAERTAAYAPVFPLLAHLAHISP